MPDEVNIDELLELESEEERSRKIQVGGRESPVHSPLPCISLKIVSIINGFIEHSLSARHCFNGFKLSNLFNLHKTLHRDCYLHCTTIAPIISIFKENDSRRHLITCPGSHSSAEAELRVRTQCPCSSGLYAPGGRKCFVTF